MIKEVILIKGKTLKYTAGLSLSLQITVTDARYLKTLGSQELKGYYDKIITMEEECR